MIRFTAARIDREFTDEFGVTIHFYQWKAGKPKGVVQLVHGLGEHAGRYEVVAQELVAAGYSVYADDHRGHGKTGMQQWQDDATRLGHLGLGGLRATVAAVHQLSGIIRQENPAVPLVLLGHSWGSVIAQKIINEFSSEYDALVLTGTAYRTLLHMRGNNLNGKHKHLGTTGYEWLSRDPKVSQAFVDDPLAFTAAALALFGLPDSLRLLGRPAKNLPNDLPILIQIGSEDSFGGERSVELLAESYLKRSRISDIEVVIYSDARHEVFNELNRVEVVADTVSWMDARIQRLQDAS